MIPAGDMSRVRGQQSRPPHAWAAPVDVECPQRGEPSAHTTHVRGPLDQSARGGNEPIVSKSETKARNGHILTKENRMIPRFIWTAEERWRSFVTVLDILARDRLRWRCQCALPSSTRSTPAMMSAMPATMVRVSGSPKRSLEAIAVTATPPADQIP